MRAAIAALVAACATLAATQPHSLRFYGTGRDDLDRVKVRLDPHVPADLGATDFTLEFWVRGFDAENFSAQISPGPNFDWINGNVVFDRDRYGDPGRDWGVSIDGLGRVAFGVMGAPGQAYTIVGTTNVLDAGWRHVAVQRRRSDGRLSIHVNGVREADADGPNGDVSYPDGAPPAFEPILPGGRAWNDPYLVFAAEKHDYAQYGGGSYPSFSGWLDEVRLSSELRYAGPSFGVPVAPPALDGATAALYRFDQPGGAALDEVGLSPGEVRPGAQYAGQTAPLYEILSGTLSQEGWTTAITEAPFVIQGLGTWVAPVGPGGAFDLRVPRGPGVLSVKLPNALRVRATYDATHGPVTGVTLVLPGGDVDDSNRVDLDDFLILASAYETDPVSDVRADLTGDGACGLEDFLILAANYERDGD